MEILHTTVKMTQIMKCKKNKKNEIDFETRITHAVQGLDFKSMKSEVVPREKKEDVP